jgi:hypothetical protein
MTQPIEDLQNHFHFQLSLLRLVGTQKPAVPGPVDHEREIPAQDDLQHAIDRIADAMQ